MTEDVTEMPRCCSSAIQSEVACRAALRPFTEPASCIAPPNSSSFSVSVVLPASGCEMIANVRRRQISEAMADISWSVGSCGRAIVAAPPRGRQGLDGRKDAEAEDVQEMTRA